MPRETFISQPEHPEKLAETIREADPEGKLKEFRQVVTWPLDDEKRRMLELIQNLDAYTVADEFFIEKLITHKDFAKQYAALHIFAKHDHAGQDQIILAEKLYRLASNGTTVTNLLLRNAIHALGALDPAVSLPILERLFDERTDFTTADAVAHAIENFGETALHLLEKIAASAANEEAFASLSDMGECAIPLLEKLARHQHIWVRDPAKKVLQKIQDKGISAEPASRLPQSHAWLFGSRKATFASGYAPELTERLLVVKRAFEKLQQQFPDVSGLIILGSTMKGYAGSESDLDYMLLMASPDPEATEVFKKMLNTQNVTPCGAYSETYKQANALSGDESLFLSGLYLGNRGVLREYQKEVVGKSSRAPWERLRQDIFKIETNLHKAKRRYGFTDVEIEKISAAAALTRVPPPHEEAKKYILEYPQQRTQTP